MSFWQSLQVAAGMSGAFGWVVVGFVIAALLLFAYIPAQRMRIRAGAGLFALALVGLAISAALLARGVPNSNLVYRWTRWSSLFFAYIAIVNVASVFVFDVALGAIGSRPPRILRDLLVAIAYIVVAISLLSETGIDLTGIIATSAVITAIIGFSLQDTLGNIMGGMALQMERTIHVGDWVRIDQQEGQITEIRWRQTSIETNNWDTIVVPNSVLMKGQVTLLGRRTGAPRQRRRWVYFNVDFRYSPGDVIGAVEAALCSDPIDNVAPRPSPNCIITDLKDSYSVYAVRYWLTDLALNDPTDSVVRQRIYFALRRAGIPLSIPAQTLFITQDVTSRRERKRNEEIQHRIEALRGVELFHTLTEEELRKLAMSLSVAPFVRGEAMTRQGATAHWLYIIIRGDAEVRVNVEGNGLSEKVATLHAGEFFGEMGLMTGSPRTATVIATTDVECYRLDKHAVFDILLPRPEIAEDISHVLARRRVQLEAAREDLNEEAMRHRMQSAQRDFLHRITHFFGL